MILFVCTRIDNCWLYFPWCRLFSSLSLIIGFQIGWTWIYKSWDAELTTMLWNLPIQFLKWVKSWLRGWGWKASISLPCIWGKLQYLTICWWQVFCFSFFLIFYSLLFWNYVVNFLTALDYLCVHIVQMYFFEVINNRLNFQYVIGDKWVCMCTYQYRTWMYMVFEIGKLGFDCIPAALNRVFMDFSYGCSLS